MIQMEYTFKSRYGDIRKVSQESKNCYIVEGKTLYHRCASDENGILVMFDFEGGPYVEVGGTGIEFDIDKKVTSIEILDAEPGSAKIKVTCV